VSGNSNLTLVLSMYSNFLRLTKYSDGRDSNDSQCRHTRQVNKNYSRLIFSDYWVKYGHYYPMGANSFHSRASGSSNWLNQFLPGI
jgi:hypothetical protein